MPGFGIQKRGTSPLLVKRKKFEGGGSATEDMSSIHEGAESAAEEARETKLEKKGYEETKTGKMIKAAKEGIKKVSETAKKNVKFVTPSPIKETPEPSDEMDEYFTKETRVGKNKYKVEKVKKSDDEIGYRRSKKAKGGSAKKGILIIIGTKDKESKKGKK
jgi:maltoporin